MADTRCQLKCEDWIRQNWMAEHFGQVFHRERLHLSSGGIFDFDAVSADGSIVATISTSGAKTASGKYAVGKLMKLRSDMLFLILAAPSRPIMVFSEKDMYAACLKEREAGRAPREIEFFHAPLPPALAASLIQARAASSREVSPRAGDATPAV